MKLRQMYVIREFNGTVYAVPTNSENEKSEPVVLNKTGRVLWQALAEETDAEKLTQMLLDEYDVEKDIAADDVNTFVSDLRRAGLLEE